MTILRSFLTRWGMPVGLLLVALVCAGLAWQGFRTASVVVEWKTASEVDAAGFRLYRSEAPSGSEVRITADLIPVRGDGLTGADYQYTDTTVAPGRSYDYWLEEVDSGGRATRTGPITVYAQGGGWVEAGMALAFLLLAGAATWFQLRPARPHA